MQLWPWTRKSGGKYQNQFYLLATNITSALQQFESRISSIESRLEAMERRSTTTDNTDVCHKLDNVMEEMRTSKSGLKDLQDSIGNLMRVLLAEDGDSSVVGSKTMKLG